jgi:glycosyltransferase involved in cell wall biosynthesis
MKLLDSRGVKAHLMIGGKGELLEELKALAVRLGIAERVTFAGFIRNEDLARYYGAADVFVMPSRELEGLGLVLLEAMACGTVALSTPIGGAPEFLEKFDKRCVFAKADAESIADGLESMLKIPDELRALSGRCREFVEKDYSWEAIAGRWLDVMESAIAG